MPIEAVVGAGEPAGDEKDSILVTICAKVDASIKEIVDIDIEDKVGDVERELRVGSRAVIGAGAVIHTARGEPVSEAIIPERRWSGVEIIGESHRGTESSPEQECSGRKCNFHLFEVPGVHYC